MNINFIKTTLLVFFLAVMIFCGGSTQNNLLGGTEIGNPPISTQRYIVGYFSDQTTTPATALHYAMECPVDLVRAVSVLEAVFETEMAFDCSFALAVDFDNIYYLEFLFEDAVVATLFVDNNSEVFQPPYFIISDADTSMNLGQLVLNGLLVIPENQPAQQNDQDGDGIHDYDDPDDDNDGILDNDEVDLDHDGIPDDFDPVLTDSDEDGVSDYADNCPDVPNDDQLDTDADGLGNVCDDDDDDDDLLDDDDNCPLVSNAEQGDADADGLGDACDDSDADGVLDLVDNCFGVPNVDQLNTDSDSLGDACDTDDDNDGILDDGDGSGTIGDYTCRYGSTYLCDDNCLVVYNPNQTDTNYNGVGDACEG